MFTGVPQQTGCGVAVGDAQFPARAVAIGIDGILRHPQLARDLLGAEMPVDETEAFPFAQGQKLDRGHPVLRGARHVRGSSKPRLSRRVYFCAAFSR